MFAFLSGRDRTFDLSSYRRDGVQLLKRFFSDAEKAQLTAMYDDFKKSVAAGQIIRTIVHTSGEDHRRFDRIDRLPSVRSLARAIVGDDYCRLISRFLVKDTTFSGAISAHQDYPYFGGCPDKLNVFVPLTPCTAENGALVFLKGSHRYGPLERGEIDIDRYPQLERLTITMEFGDVAIADFLTWHYSVPATEVSDRVMVQVVYQSSTDPSSKYVVSGRVLNDADCPDRAAPLRTRQTLICYDEARTLFQHKSYDAAKRVAWDILSGDANNIQVLLLLRRIYALEGDSATAKHYDERARAAILAASEACAAEDT